MEIPLASDLHDEKQKKLTKKAFSRLKTYRISSDLDRLLIKGIFDSKERRAQNKKSANVSQESGLQLATIDGLSSLNQTQPSVQDHNNQSLTLGDDRLDHQVSTVQLR